MSHEVFHYKQLEDVRQKADQLHAFVPLADGSDALFTPLTLGSHRVENRIAFQPMEGTDGTEDGITTPYCIAVNPANGDIFLTDAKDHVTPGYIHCYGQDGVRKWSARTGDIPGHIVFTTKQLKPLEQI